MLVTVVGNSIFSSFTHFLNAVEPILFNFDLIITDFNLYKL